MNNSHISFSQKLIHHAQPHWQQATEHQFIREMVDATLDNNAFAYSCNSNQ